LRKRSHPGAESLQNTKPSGPKEEYLQIHHNQNTQDAKQRILKAAKEKRQESRIKVNPLK
jgi:hypothetical protein